MGPTQAQTPFPPPALLNAPTIDAAAGILGVGRPEYSTHLLLDVPDISLPGTVTAKLRSELPGTLYIVLVRAKATLREAAPAQPGGRTQNQPAKAVAGAKAGVVPTARSAAPAMPSVYIAAKRFEPGETPEIKASFELGAADAVTMFAYAQGRWFVTGREIKLARPPSALP
jgi:hypothetical protein